MSNWEHHRIDLTDTERERIQEIAVRLGARPTRGPARRTLPDWKWVVRLIGQGKLLVVDPAPYSLPDGLAEQAEAVQERQRLEQARIEQVRRVEAHTAAKQAVRKTPVKLEQLQMELEPA